MRGSAGREGSNPLASCGGREERGLCVWPSATSTFSLENEKGINLNIYLKKNETVPADLMHKCAEQQNKCDCITSTKQRHILHTYDLNLTKNKFSGIQCKKEIAQINYKDAAFLQQFTLYVHFLFFFRLKYQRFSGPFFKYKFWP